MRFNQKRIINYIAVAAIVGFAYLFNDGQIPTFDQSPQSSQSSKKQSSSQQKVGNFDHYLMALSWSPTFCADNKNDHREQCGANRNYAFVVHGLWPQYDRGGWPDFCKGDSAGRVPDDIADDVFGIMPSRGLIGHQWKKHGTCSGLDVDDYFTTVQKAYDNIVIPQQFQALTQPLKVSPAKIRKEFAKANPGLNENSVSVTCDNRLREVRICMTKSLGFMDCSKSGKQCKSKSVLMLPSRG